MASNVRTPVEEVLSEQEAPRALARLGLLSGASGPLSSWKELEDRFRAFGQAWHVAIDPEGPRRSRLSVFVNDRLPGRLAYFGLLELPAAEPGAALAALLGPAEDWCRSRGAGLLRGPIAYSTWYPNRCVLTETLPDRFPGDSPYPSSLVEPLEGAGMRLAKEYFSAITGPLEAFVRRIDPVRRHARAQGFAFSVLESAAIPELFSEAHGLAQRAFGVNHSFTPIDREEFSRLFASVPRLPEAAVVAGRDAAGRLAGFALGYGAPGFELPSAPGARVAVLKSIAVDPDYSGGFCGAALSAELHRHFLQRGFGRVIHALMAKERYALGTRSRLIETFRTYGMFEKSL